MKLVRRPPPELRDTIKQKIEKSLRELRDYFAGGAVGPRPKIDNDAYRAYKDALLEEFHYKCAFCDRKLGAALNGDVEHLRPKNGVRNADGQRVRSASGCDHPGYWWLAYDWRNLVIACKDCNTRYKGERFVVEESRYAEREGELDKSLLIHHHLDEVEPMQNFRVNTLTGALVPMTERGEVTVAVLQLNREVLCDERRDELDHVSTDFTAAMSPHADPDFKSRALRRLREVHRGEYAHSYFCKQFLDDQRAQALAAAQRIAAAGPGGEEAADPADPAEGSND